MVHKVFTSGSGDELTVYINHTDDLYIRIENREQREELCIVLDLEDATELYKELGELIRTLK